MARWSLAWTQDNWGLEAREQLAACLVLEEASHNTAASAANTLPLVQGLGGKAVGLVSDSLHFRRAHYLFRGCFARHGILVHSLPARGLVRHYWRQRRYWWLGKMALREGGAWLKVLGNLVWDPEAPGIMGEAGDRRLAGHWASLAESEEFLNYSVCHKFLPFGGS